MKHAPTLFALLVLACAATAVAAALPTSVPAPSASGPTSRSTRALIAGADVSMLPEIEKAGGTFRRRPGDAAPADALDVLRDHGCTLFRVRLFVDPATDFAASHGATQDLNYVVALARRIKARPGAQFLLDLHYSDTWADPGKQFKPAAWKELDFDALEKRVHDYTASVLKTLADAGATPDMVQVGNEITSGMIWPEGKVLDAKGPDRARRWRQFARLFNAGARAVREARTADHPIRVLLHIHGGGRAGLPQWFFEQFNANPVEYDVIALSFYPAWDDALDALKRNAADLVRAWGKDILIAETSYPWRPLEGHEQGKSMPWPQTRQGQVEFVTDLAEAIRAIPGEHGLGFVWWYPEAIPVPGRPIWRNGAEALFDRTGEPLPALAAFSDVSRTGEAR